MTSTVVVTADRPEDFRLQRPNPTYNIVVTKNPIVTQKLFYDRLGRSSLSDLFERLSDSEKTETLIVSPMRNNNFVSFDIDFPKAQAQKYAVLKLIETTELLEYFQVSKKGLEELIKLRAKIEKSLKGVGAVVDFASNIKPTFYISFGMGDDVREWSGPYVVELIDANITSTSDNVRQLELMFSPTVEGQAVFTNKIFNDTEYAQIRSIFDGVLTGDEKADFTSNDIFDRLPEGEDDIRRIARDAVSLKPSLDVGGNGTNFGVRRIAKKFLSERFNLPLDNVLFLTDADWGFLDKFKPDEEEYQTKISKYGIKVDSPILPNSKLSKEQRDEKFSELNKTKAKMAKQIANNNASIQQKEKEINQIDYKIIADSEIVKAAYKAGDHGSGTFEGYIRNKYRITPDGRIVSPGRLDPIPSRRSEIIQKNNSDLAKSLKKEKQRKQEEVRNKKKEIKIDEEKQIKAGEEQLRIGYVDKKIADAYRNNQDFTVAAPVRDRGKIRFTMSTDTSPSKSHDSQLNVLQPLHDMIKEIKKGSDLTTLSDFTLIEENDHRILRDLQQNGLIGSSDSPVIIFGNQRIINALVYPGLFDKPKEDLKEDLIFYEMVQIGTEVPLRNTLNPYFYKGRKVVKGTNSAKAGLGAPPLPNLKESSVGYTAKAENLKDAVRIFSVKWKEYAQDFRDNMRVRSDGLKTSSFREKPNFYSYGTEVNLELQKLTDPLIFMSNVTNANVESISFDSSPYKAVLMNAGHESGYRLLQENVQTSSLVSDNEIFSPSLAKIIDQMAKSFNSTVKDKKPAEFLKELKEGDTRKLVLSIVTENNNQDDVGGTSVKSLLDFVLLKAGTPPTFKKTVEPGKVGTADADVLRNMSQYIINVRLKTLPFFNTIMKPGRDCFLFGLSNNVIGSTSLRDTPAPAFFTGAYTIISYKHSISHDGAFSEFELIPNGAGIGTISGDISLLEFFNITQEDIDEELKKKKEAAEAAANAAKAEKQTKKYAQQATNPFQQGAK